MSCVVSSCAAETRQRLERACRTRGLYVRDAGGGNYEIEAGNGGWTFTLMPGNRRVLISQHAFVHPGRRGKGYGRRYLRWRAEIADEIGCNLLLATVREDNIVQTHLLESEGWKRYNNRDTGVSLWGKEL